MAIKTPVWAEKAGAYPTRRGWTVDRPKGRAEVIRARRFTADEISQWWAERDATPVVESAPAPAPAPEPVVQTLHEAPVEEHEVSDEEVDWHYGDDDE